MYAKTWKRKKDISIETNLNTYVAYFDNETKFNKVSDSLNRDFESAVSKSQKKILINIKERW